MALIAAGWLPVGVLCAQNIDPQGDTFAVETPLPLSGDPEMVARCREMLGLRKPVVEIESVRPQFPFSTTRYEIRGAILSSCVQDAGYYEEGRLRERFPFPLEDRMRRREFTISVESGHRGEIRVTTADGRQDTARVDDEIRREQIRRLIPFH